jgi:hypothetical protein
MRKRPSLPDAEKRLPSTPADALTSSRSNAPPTTRLCRSAAFLLENDPSEVHIRRMKKYRSRILEVSVTHHPPRWEWEVTSDGESIANGFEREQTAAKFEGYNAMFFLLAAGWNL